jgi:transcription elongation factor Elf1
VEDSRAKTITRERAERIARSQACANCGEYSFKRFMIKPATDAQRKELGIAWQATKTCGVCGAVQEVGIDEDGDVVYEG